MESFCPKICYFRPTSSLLVNASSAARGRGKGGGYSPPIGMSTKMQNGENHNVFSTFETVYALEWTINIKTSFETYVQGGLTSQK